MLWRWPKKAQHLHKMKEQIVQKPGSLACQAEETVRNDFYKVGGILFPKDIVCRRSNPSATVFGSKGFKKSIKVK